MVGGCHGIYTNISVPMKSQFQRQRWEIPFINSLESSFASNIGEQVNKRVCELIYCLIKTDESANAGKGWKGKQGLIAFQMYAPASL